MSLAGLMGRGAKGRSKLVQKASYMCQHGAKGLPPAKQTRGSHWKLFSEQFIPEQGTSEFMNF